MLALIPGERKWNWGSYRHRRLLANGLACNISHMRKCAIVHNGIQNYSNHCVLSLRVWIMKKNWRIGFILYGNITILRWSFRFNRHDIVISNELLIFEKKVTNWIKCFQNVHSALTIHKSSKSYYFTKIFLICSICFYTVPVLSQTSKH